LHGRRPLTVVEERDGEAEALREQGYDAVAGNAAQPETLALARLDRADRLLVAIPNAFEAGQIIEQARAANPGLDIVARAHSDAEVEHLTA
ncbi:NAD-binding protein, partial [Acinetobacter baumannii]